MQKSSTLTDLTVIWEHRTDSTNLDAFRHRNEYPDKTVWAAEHQWAGRGQRGNVWNSECAENLTFSILLKPVSIKASRQFILSMAASVAVADYLLSKGIRALIKWPNDIYVGDRKICGMLIEHTVSGDNVSASVVGIGINVMQERFPPELPNPTSVSLCLGGGVSFDLKAELVSFLHVFYGIYDSLPDSEAVSRLEGKYTSLLYRKGEWHRYVEKSPDGLRELSLIEGRIAGVDGSTSRLMLELHDGTVKQYAFKEISYVL